VFATRVGEFATSKSGRKINWIFKPAGIKLKDPRFREFSKSMKRGRRKEREVGRDTDNERERGRKGSR